MENINRRADVPRLGARRPGGRTACRGGRARRGDTRAARVGWGALPLLLAAWALTGGAAHATPFLPIPPDSFLNYPVGTVPELAHQVGSDPAVQARLARHFHMSPAALRSYLGANLVLTRLPKAQRLHVWCVSRSGREYMLTQRLPAGTPVFALAGTRQPLFKKSCGNPLIAALPYVAPKKLALKPRRPAPRLAPPVVASDPAAESATLRPVVIQPGLVAFTGLVDVPGVQPPPVIKVAGYTAVLTRPSRNILAPLLALAGLGSLFPAALTASNAAGIPLAGGGTGGTGGGTGPVIVPVLGPTDPATVPEPSPLLVFGFTALGGAALMLRARRRCPVPAA